MELTEIMNLIGNNAFPVLMCIIIFKQMNEQDKRHYDEMTKFTESLNNNTIAITKLSEKLDQLEDTYHAKC